MPYAPPYIPRFAHPSQHPVDPRSLELYDPNKLPYRRGLRPEVMQNPEYWPDDSTTHIFPDERNPTRREGVQGISAPFFPRGTVSFPPSERFGMPQPLDEYSLDLYPQRGPPIEALPIPNTQDETVPYNPLGKPVPFSRPNGVQGISAEQLVRILGLGDRLLGLGRR